MGRIIIASMLMLFLINEQVCSQSFSYKNINNYLFNQYITPITLPNEDAFELEDALPKSFKRDGSVDYTDIVQTVLNRYKVVVFPDFPLLISNKGLNLRSNSTIYFKKNSVLLLKGSAISSYSVLRIYNVENVKIYNARIEGDRNFITSRKGEWGMGIRIQNSRNVQIFSPYIKNCWGDGIYIGQDSKQSRETSDVLIEGGIIDNCRRNSISITCGKNIRIRSILLANSNGTLPMSGLVIEPNFNSDYIQQILLDNIISYNNAESGYIFSVAKLYGRKKNEISIIGNNLSDKFSKNGLYVAGLHWRYLGSNPPNGDIELSNLNLYGNKIPLTLGDNFDKGINVNIKQVMIFDNASTSTRNKIKENKVSNSFRNKANVNIRFVN